MGSKNNSWMSFSDLMTGLMVIFMFVAISYILEVQQAEQQRQKVVTDFDSIAQMVMDPQADVKGFVINPFGKSVTFPKQMVHSFKQQKDYMKRKNQTIEPDCRAGPAV